MTYRSFTTDHVVVRCNVGWRNYGYFEVRIPMSWQARLRNSDKLWQYYMGKITSMLWYIHRQERKRGEKEFRHQLCGRII